jgi:outer membrane protein OmpA-like peptidoglycan-associated protein
MSLESNSNDGSDIFWPGYVDAVTNLVLNLLFLLTIMTVAVFMFALELGRASLGAAGKAPVVSAQTDPKTPSDPIKENAELKREIELLNKKLAQLDLQKTRAGGPLTIIPATSAVAQPKKGLDKALATDTEVIVRFTDEAVTLNPAELKQLREALKVIVAGGKARIAVVVPSGFSEARRMGYYRAMAVRNLLIEMKLPQNRIDVSVKEGKSSSNASLVRVTP